MFFLANYYYSQHQIAEKDNVKLIILLIILDFGRYNLPKNIFNSCFLKQKSVESLCNPCPKILTIYYNRLYHYKKERK